MIDYIKSQAQKAERQLGGYYVATVDTNSGQVECIAQQVPRLKSMHWRYNFKLNGKVISAEELRVLI